MASQNPYQEPMLRGLSKTGPARVTVQADAYTPIISALTKAVRAKNKPAPAASKIAPDPYTQTSGQGSEAGNGSARLN